MPGDMIMTRTAATMTPARHSARSARASNCLSRAVYAQAMSPVLSVEESEGQDRGNLVITGRLPRKTTDVQVAIPSAPNDGS